MSNLMIVMLVVGFITYNIAVISVTRKFVSKGKSSVLHRTLIGIAMCGTVAILIATVLIASYLIHNSLFDDIDNSKTSSIEQIETTEPESPIHDKLANTLFSFVDTETGKVNLETEQELREKLESDYNISTEDYDFDLLKIKKGIREDNSLYRYTVISSGDKPEKTNDLGEWAITQIDNTVDIENTTNANGEVDSNYIPIKTVLHIGVDDNTDKSEAEVYLPSTESKTYICLVEIDWRSSVVDLYPIFFSPEPNKLYLVRPNLYKLNIDDTDMKQINKVIDCDNTDEIDNSLIKKPISSKTNKVTIQITDITDKKIIGTIENKNTFEIYIDNATWKNNDDNLGDSLLRVKANNKQEFEFKYTGEINHGDELIIEGEMKDVDAAFSSIGKVKFTFKLE